MLVESSISTKLSFVSSSVYFVLVVKNTNEEIIPALIESTMIPLPYPINPPENRSEVIFMFTINFKNSELFMLFELINKDDETRQLTEQAIIDVWLDAPTIPPDATVKDSSVPEFIKSRIDTEIRYEGCSSPESMLMLQSVAESV
jgi:hypothetical protein